MDIPVAVSIGPKCVIDLIRIESSGLLLVIGWASPADRDTLRSLSVRVNASPVPQAGVYRYLRPDVKRVHSEADEFWGICVEFSAPEGIVREVDLSVNDGTTETIIFRNTDLNEVCRQPDYSILQTTDEVMHREQMYGSGLPARGYNQELGLLASGLTGRVLDFGCGLGPLVAMLRERGTEAEGLEIDRPAIASALPDEVRPYIRLYDGTFPAPFEAGSFDWVICSEVLEHIPDYRAAITEIARIARQGLILTVPDMSAVPMLHKHNVVPWHLLESTHVNFFTQRSLAATLQPHFTQLDFLRICRGIVNDTNYWTSLAVIARH